MAKKILEIKGESFLKGLAYQKFSPYGGLFRQATNFSPFTTVGLATPSYAISDIGAGSPGVIAKSIRKIVPVADGSNLDFYLWSDDATLYRLRGGTVTDVTSSYNINTSITGTARGACLWKGKFVYVTEQQARRIDVGGAGGTEYLLVTLSSGYPHVPVLGADGNLYISNANNVAKLTSTTVSGSNSSTVAASLNADFTVRSLVNDGRYLVWFADNGAIDGPTPGTTVSYKNRCIVAFWDLAKSVFDQIYEFEDSGIVGARMIGNVIKFITPSGVYETAFGLFPRKVFPFGLTADGWNIPRQDSPIFDSNLTTFNNILHWGSANLGVTNPIYAYGNLLGNQKQIAFQPYTSTLNASGGITALGTGFDKFLVASNLKLYDVNASGTYSTSVFNLANIPLDKPYNFGYAKVILQSPISSGNSVALKIMTSNDARYVSASETKTNSTDPGVKALIFDGSANGSNDVKAFNDISSLELTTNVPFYSICLYGTPEDDRGDYG
jgi:hypothetical protein